MHHGFRVDGVSKIAAVETLENTGLAECLPPHTSHEASSLILGIHVQIGDPRLASWAVFKKVVQIAAGEARVNAVVCAAQSAARPPRSPFLRSQPAAAGIFDCADHAMRRCRSAVSV